MMERPQRPPDRGNDRRRHRRNRRTGLMLLTIVAGMVGLSFAAVPLYQLFCQVTGYGGTTQVAERTPEQIDERIITVRFNADIAPDLPWTFVPAQRLVKLRVGESGLAFYRAKNRSDKPIVGTAAFNVSPPKAGPYFVKVQCFCFEEQRLGPGEEVDMPVSFFIDPEMNGDRNLDEVVTITLSYTFFRSPDSEAGDDSLARADSAQYALIARAD